MAYDVERNAEIFFKDLQDGVSSLLVGKMSSLSPPIVVAGGNCSIFGFDKEGSEIFWTVTGDNVSSLALVDIPSAKGSSKKELVVGSDDFEIRVFQGDELVKEITEADKVLFLCAMQESKFAYGLSNGTVGVYNSKKNRSWRVKAKHQVTALLTYDLDCDGVEEVVSGWSNGSFNVRKESTGEIIFKDTMSAPIAAIVKSDYRMDGKEALMIISESGEVRAYLSTDMDLTLAMDTPGAGVVNATGEQKALADLHQKKQELMAQLRSLEKSLNSKKTGEVVFGSLPPNTALTYSLKADADAGCIMVKVDANTDVQLNTILGFDSGNFHFTM